MTNNNVILLANHISNTIAVLRNLQLNQMPCSIRNKVPLIEAESCKLTAADLSFFLPSMSVDLEVDACDVASLDDFDDELPVHNCITKDNLNFN